MPIFVLGVGCRPVAEGERRHLTFAHLRPPSPTFAEGERRHLAIDTLNSAAGRQGGQGGQGSRSDRVDGVGGRGLVTVTRPFVISADASQGSGGSSPYQPVFEVPNSTWPTGCSSGFVTGTELDRARCVVVELDLRSNNLSGAFQLDSLVALLPNLQVLRLDNNSLTGPVPERIVTNMLRMDTLGLAANRFDYAATTPKVFWT